MVITCKIVLKINRKLSFCPYFDRGCSSADIAAAIHEDGKSKAKQSKPIVQSSIRTFVSIALNKELRIKPVAW